MSTLEIQCFLAETRYINVRTNLLLENFLNFVTSFQGTGKLLEEHFFFLYSWCSPGILWGIILYYKNNLQISEASDLQLFLI